MQYESSNGMHDTPATNLVGKLTTKNITSYAQVCTKSGANNSAKCQQASFPVIDATKGGATQYIQYSRVCPNLPTKSPNTSKVSGVLGHRARRPSGPRRPHALEKAQRRQGAASRE